MKLPLISGSEAVKAFHPSTCRSAVQTPLGSKP